MIDNARPGTTQGAPAVRAGADLPGCTGSFCSRRPAARGRRAELLLRDGADSPLARTRRTPPGAELGEVFTFLSGLYFRGKLSYARVFGRAPAGLRGVEVNRGDMSRLRAAAARGR